MKIPTRRSLAQKLKDHLAAPLRLTVLSDEQCERLGLTSINAERIAVALRHMRGRLLDVGCGRNLLVQNYVQNYEQFGVGVDVFDWRAGALIVPDTSKLPFKSASFDTVAILAALNHIPNRDEVLDEVHRLLRSDGQLVMTMINPLLSGVGHRVLWWYGEDWARGMEEGEVYGFWTREIVAMCARHGFTLARHERFLYGLNNLYVFRKAGA